MIVMCHNPRGGFTDDKDQRIYFTGNDNNKKLIIIKKHFSDDSSRGLGSPSWH